MFRCREVTKRYRGEVALPPTTYDFPESGIVGLVGPNGSGKTTLLNILTGLEAPSSGSCSFRGVETRTIGIAGLAQAGILRLFQIPRLAEGMTVGDHILSIIEPDYGLLRSIFAGRTDRRSEVAGILADSGLSHAFGLHASDLSFGQKRRLCLGFAKARSPLRALILDEPFAGLDQGAKDSLRSWLTDFSEAKGGLVILVEHQEELLQSLTSKIVRLRRRENE